MKAIILIIALMFVGCSYPTGSEENEAPAPQMKEYSNYNDTLKILSKESLTYIFYGSTMEDSLFKEDITPTELRLADSLYLSVFPVIRDTIIIRTLSYRLMTDHIDTFYNVNSNYIYYQPNPYDGRWSDMLLWEYEKELENKLN